MGQWPATGATGPNGTDEPRGAEGTFGTTGSEVRPDAAPCPAATFVEDAAIIANDDGRNQTTADTRIPAEFGPPPWSATADTLRERILAQLDNLPRASTDDGRRLLATTRAFLASDHWQQAIALDWPMIELFGIDQTASLTSLPSQGGVAALAMSRLNLTCLENIAEDHAIIRCCSGTLLTYRRGSVRLDTVVLWWESPALIGSSEHMQ